MPRLNYLTDGGVTGTTLIARGYEGAYGAEPVGPPLDNVYFQKAGSKRKKGAQVRCLLVRIPDGPPTPSGAQPYRFNKATVGSPTVFAAYALGSNVTIKGVDWEIYGKQAEG